MKIFLSTMMSLGLLLGSATFVMANEPEKHETKKEEHKGGDHKPADHKGDHKPDHAPEHK